MACGDPNCYICNPGYRMAAQSAVLERALEREQERYSLLSKEKEKLEKRLNELEKITRQTIEYEI